MKLQRFQAWWCGQTHCHPGHCCDWILHFHCWSTVAIDSLQSCFQRIPDLHCLRPAVPDLWCPWSHDRTFPRCLPRIQGRCWTAAGTDAWLGWILQCSTFHRCPAKQKQLCSRQIKQLRTYAILNALPLFPTNFQGVYFQVKVFVWFVDFRIITSWYNSILIQNIQQFRFCRYFTNAYKLCTTGVSASIRPPNIHRRPSVL